MKLRNLLACAPLLLATQVGAQISIGPAAGFRFTSYTTRSPDKIMIPKNGEMSMLDLQAGAITCLGISKRFQLQSGLLFTTNRYKKEGLTPENQVVSVYYNIRSLELPITVAINTNSGKHGSFFLGAGGFVACNVSGKQIKRNELVSVPAPGAYRGFVGIRVPISVEHLQFGSETPSAYRLMGLGAGINAGYQHPGGLLLRAHYQQGLRSQSLPQLTNYKTTSANFGLMVGFLLGHPCKKGKANEEGQL
jgi:hypothetical protein